MIRITDNHAARLARLRPANVVPPVAQSLEASAHVIAEFAAESIKAGAVSGPGHVPSRPGEPPNADTHDLDRSIHVGEMIETPDRVQTSVIADSDHALFMELGTSKVAERPFMRPAVAQNRDGTLHRLGGAFRRAVGIE